MVPAPPFSSTRLVEDALRCGAGKKGNWTRSI